MATRDINLVVRETSEGRALVKAGDDMHRLADETGKADNKAKLYTEDQKRLAAEIEKSTTKVRSLREQIARTGDTSLFGDLRKEESRLKSFERLSVNLAKDFEQAGKLAGDTFAQSFSSAIEGELKTPGVTQALLIGLGSLVAISAAPLGAAIAGLLVGTVGTGGVVGGVLAASHDPKVKSAFGELLEVAKNEFFGAGDAFVGPAIDAAHTFEKALKDIHLDKVLAPAASDVHAIADGFAKFGTNLAPGLQKLFERSGPFAEAASKGIAEAGTALSVFFDQISASHGSVEGLAITFKTLNVSIALLGANLRILSDTFHAFGTVQTSVLTGLDHGLGAIGIHIGPLHNLAKTMQDFIGVTDESQGVVRAFSGEVYRSTAATNDNTAALQRQQTELQDTIDAINKLVNGMLGLDGAQLNVAQGFQDLDKALQENGRHWNDNSAAAIANRRAILDQISNLEAVREREIENGKSLADANAEYIKGVEATLKYASALGATKDQLDKLRASYELLIGVAAIGAKIKSIASLFQFGGGRAGGGPVKPGMAYRVNENTANSEWFVPSTPGYIAPAAAMSGGGQGGANVTIVLPGGGDIGTAVVAHLAKHAQIYGGGNVQLAITGRMN